MQEFGGLMLEAALETAAEMGYEQANWRLSAATGRQFLCTGDLDSKNTAPFQEI